MDGVKCNNPDCLFLHEYNDTMKMFSCTKPTNNEFLKETNPALPGSRILFERNKKQRDGFPPSYRRVQSTEKHEEV